MEALAKAFREAAFSGHNRTPQPDEMAELTQFLEKGSYVRRRCSATSGPAWIRKAA